MRTATRATHGMLVTPHPLATRAGADVLSAGGNAVDAAVATALALAVVYPEAGNLGGGGFALVRMGGEVTALDFRETAPAEARRDMYLDGQGKPIENASLVGPLAAGARRGAAAAAAGGDAAHDRRRRGRCLLPRRNRR